MYLLDTNVVSELRKLSAGRADAQVVRWAERTDASVMYLSVVTIQELDVGLLRIERRDRVQAARLREWMDSQVLPAFEGRILPVDIAVARCGARLHVPDPRPVRDALIAATAIVHGLTVVTRDATDFAPMGVPLLNPWAAN